MQQHPQHEQPQQLSTDTLSPPPIMPKPGLSTVAQRQQELARAALQHQLRPSPTPLARPLSRTPSANIERFRVLYAFAKQQDGDLQMEKGDLLEVLDRSKGDWWQARNLNSGEMGMVPGNYLERV